MKRSFGEITQTQTGYQSWLDRPTTVSADVSPTEELLITEDFLQQKLVENLQKNGIYHYFPIQKQLLFQVRESFGDICVSASTGSGKTLSYVLPILTKLWNRVIKRVRCLIVVPTRELTLQVKQQIDLLSNNHLKTAALGINSFKSEQKNLDADIIITTPGRLLDHLDFEPGLLNCLEYLVMDEADRLMNQHYQGWLNRVLGLFHEPKPMLSSTHSSDILKGMSMQTKKRVRKLLFSATLSHNPAKIEMLKLVKPVLITLSEQKYSLPLTLLERYYTTQKQQKPLLLLSILESKSLIFVKSVQGSQRLFTLIKTALEYLDKNISCGLITSGMLNKDREKIIKQFKRGDVGVLFCSDVLSRGSIILTKGIDLGEARYVFNYDIPSSFVTYVHRVGRTARAGQSGTAITFVEQGQLSWFKSEIVKPIKRNLEEVTETLNGKYEDAYMKGLKELKRIYGNKQIEDDEQDDKQETVDNLSIEAKENLAVSSTSDECTSSSENE